MTVNPPFLDHSKESVLMEVEDLSLHCSPRGTAFKVPLIEDISFSLNQGEILALVGESGSGKSLTAQTLLGLFPSGVRPTQGQIRWEGLPLLTVSPHSFDYRESHRGRSIGMVFQNSSSVLNPLHTLEKQIAEGLLLHFPHFSKSQRRERVLELLDQVGFPSGRQRLSAFPHELSGGQQQRLMIAMALACGPKVLIADEPTTALDPETQEGVLTLLQTLSSTTSILLISHDLSVVSRIAHRIVVMNKGRIVEINQTDRLFSHPQHSYTQLLIESDPSRLFPAPQTEGKGFSDLVPRLEVQHLSVRLPPPSLLSGISAFLKEKILHSSQSSRESPQSKKHFLILDTISFSLAPGETVGIIGESGSGKSTLAYALLDLLPPSFQKKGKILYNGKPLYASPSWRAHLQVVFQDPFSSLNPRFSARELIGEGLRFHYPALTRKEQNEKVIEALEDVGLSQESLDRYPSEFSGGQRQRLCLARALILKPKILILDEPTSALDRSIQGDILALLRTQQEKEGISYILISHDPAVIQALSHRIFRMKAGRIHQEERMGRKHLS